MATNASVTVRCRPNATVSLSSRAAAAHLAGETVFDRDPATVIPYSQLTAAYNRTVLAAFQREALDVLCNLTDADRAALSYAMRSAPYTQGSTLDKNTWSYYSANPIVTSEVDIRSIGNGP